MGHGTGHDSFWRTLQRNHLVPKEVEYDEVPRGRVGYSTKAKVFFLFADGCILKDKRMLDMITQELNLPVAATAPPGPDPHYKCPGCRKKTQKQIAKEESDWDF
jgi:hypothetical protein